jgi:hypothetical protein
MVNSSRLAQWSVRIYKMLICAYPAAFRKEFGDEMVAIFRHLAADAHRRRGIVGLFAICFRVLADLVRTVPKEHWAEWNNQGENAMTFKSVLMRKIGPDHFSPRWARRWILVFSFMIMALSIKALTNMKLTSVEQLFGILLIAAMTLQGISYGLLVPLLHRNDASRFNNSASQIVIYAASLIVMVLGIRSLVLIVQTEFQLFIGVLLCMNVMMNGCFIAAMLPFVRAYHSQRREQQRAELTLADG